MNILVTGLMGQGTIQAKLEPLSKIEIINKIIFVRKKIGPEIPKVKYVILPKICKYKLLNILITPLYVIVCTLVYKVKVIISYHIIPYAFIAYISSIITRSPYFICQTGLRIQILSNNYIFWLLLKLIINKSKFLCVPGESTYVFWINKGISEDKLVRLHSTVDTEKYVSKPNIFKNYDFIYVGRFAKVKRIDFLLYAFRNVCNEFRSATLLIVGSGPESENIENKLSELNLNKNVTSVGFQRNVLPYLQQSKSVVLTSYSEGLPCAVMEAMSVGLVPVTTCVGNLSDIVINSKTGFCICKDNLEDYSNALISILKMDEKTFHKMSTESRKIIVNYHSYEFATKEWYKII